MTIEKQQQKIIQNIDSILNKKIITDEEIKTQLNDLVRDVENDFFMVVVLGEFKRGKSTFINSLLGANLLPTDVLPETAVISAIAYNDTPGVEAVYQDGTTEKNTLDAAYLNRFSANGPSNEYQNIKYLKINYPADILKNHLILVDTPGVDDLNEQRCDVTYNFIPKANVILFLLDAKSPLKETEMEFIEEHILPMGLDNIIFLINKYDNVDDEEDEDYLAKVKNRIQSAFSKEHSNILRLCHNKQLINSHFYRGVSELPYKLLFAVIYTHLEFRYEVSHTITSHHVHHFHQTRIPDGTLLDYMVQYRKPLFPQFFLYPKKFLPENNPHHKEFHLRPYIQNNANQ